MKCEETPILKLNILILLKIEAPRITFFFKISHHRVPEKNGKKRVAQIDPHGNSRVINISFYFLYFIIYYLVYKLYFIK